LKQRIYFELTPALQVPANVGFAARRVQLHLSKLYGKKLQKRIITKHIMFDQRGNIYEVLHFLRSQFLHGENLKYKPSNIWSCILHKANQSCMTGK
jgi:hypothetical protein